MSMENIPGPKIAKVESGNDTQEQITEQEAMLTGNVAALNERYEEIFKILQEEKTPEPAPAFTPEEIAESENRHEAYRRLNLDEAFKSIEELVAEVNAKLKERSVLWPLSAVSVGIVAGPAGAAKAMAIAEVAAVAIWGVQRLRLLIMEAKGHTPLAA